MKKIMLKKSKGQGVIEYAGALVIAAVLVSVVLAVGPEAMEDLFTEIFTSVADMIRGDNGLGQVE